MIEIEPIETGHWYLLETKFRQEKKAAQELRQQSISVFLPFHKHEKLIKGNKVIKQEPLFSRYIFAYLDLETTNWVSIRSTRGIRNIVEFGNGPLIVAQAIINELEMIDKMQEEPYIKIGEKVRIVSGSLEGLSAIYKIADGSSRAYVLLEFMQQNQYLSIDNKLIEKM